MRIPRVYSPQQLAIGELELDSAASHYLSRVLRCREGSLVDIFDGKGNCYRATVSQINKKFVIVSLFEAVRGIAESPLNIHLAISISKGDRMDWVLQKATELGVTAITPLYSSRTEVKLTADREIKKHQHWQQVIISACEQCGRNTLPLLLMPCSIEQFLEQPQQTACRLVLHHRAAKPLQAISEMQTRNIILLIGPEGGLDEQEIRYAEQQGFEAVVFGPRILRTETAPLTAISILQYLWGDLG